MSTTVPPTQLDLQEQLARVFRMNEETLKFTAEQHKLQAEAAKLERDRSYLPVTLVAALMGAGAALFAAGAGFLKLLGH